MIAPPAFVQVDVALCEDGVSKVAYAYPRADSDHGVVVMNLDDLPPEAFPVARHLED
ncbi:MAG TPA: hypothetical protein GX000_06175, partial [Actinomyces sp.]|nr:hypothetical protein [Actinomyces sp.]